MTAVVIPRRRQGVFVIQANIEAFAGLVAARLIGRRGAHVAGSRRLGGLTGSYRAALTLAAPRARGRPDVIGAARSHVGLWRRISAGAGPGALRSAEIESRAGRALRADIAPRMTPGGAIERRRPGVVRTGRGGRRRGMARPPRVWRKLRISRAAATAIALGIAKAFKQARGAGLEFGLVDDAIAVGVQRIKHSLDPLIRGGGCAVAAIGPGLPGARGPIIRAGAFHARRGRREPVRIGLSGGNRRRNGQK